MKGLNKKLILIVTLTVFLMCTLLIGYNSDKKKQLKITKLDKDTRIVEGKKEILYNIDSISLSNGLGNITGWAVINGVNSYNIMPTLILKGEDGDLYKVRTRIIKRTDITKLFNAESTDANTHLTCVTPSGLGVTKNKNVYDNSGIDSEFKIDDLKRNQSYKIGIQLQVNKINYFIWTNKELTL
ncbi:MAG: hypothetical protein ABF633_08200 [Clostridium sp.]|uniref:hypothetical protein n=1 Tax=Clostridium sp. TaxID=1506 RepID=UPI0039E7DC16